MKTKNSFKAIVLVVLLVGLLVPFLPVSAAEKVQLPAFTDFVTSVTNGQATIVRGVYVPGVMAYRVVTQSSDNPGYVSQAEGVVTQFGMAVQYKVIGLLAHNYLAGASFSNLSVGQEIRIIFGDGRVVYYTVNRVARFQALQPISGYSNFVDLSSNVTYTAQDIFTKFYQGGDHVTFQTCILRDGNSSWGRLFVTAVPSSAAVAMSTMRVSQSSTR